MSSREPFAVRWTRLVRVARPRFGLFTIAEAEACGIARQTLASLMDQGRIERLYDGVYGIIGVEDGWDRRAVAALLAGGPCAALDREAAGYVLRLLDVGRPKISLLFPRGRLRDVPGIETRRTRSLRPEDIVVVGAHRVTCVEWTLRDLAVARGPRWAERAFHDAWRRRLTDPSRARAHLDAHPRMPGNPILRSVVDDVEPRVLRAASPAEVDGILEVRRHGVPMPEVNFPVEIGGRIRYIDYAWPLVKLAVEIDGRATHSIPPDIAADRARQAELEAAGWEVIRIPAAWLKQDPARVAATILAALERRGHPAVA